MQSYAHIWLVKNALRGYIKAEPAAWVKTQALKPVCASRIRYYDHSEPNSPDTGCFDGYWDCSGTFGGPGFISSKCTIRYASRGSSGNASKATAAADCFSRYVQTEPAKCFASRSWESLRHPRSVDFPNVCSISGVGYPIRVFRAFHMCATQRCACASKPHVHPLMENISQDETESAAECKNSCPRASSEIIFKCPPHGACLSFAFTVRSKFDTYGTGASENDGQSIRVDGRTHPSIARETVRTREYFGNQNRFHFARDRDFKPESGSDRKDSGPTRKNDGIKQRRFDMFLKFANRQQAHACPAATNGNQATLPDFAAQPTTDTRAGNAHLARYRSRKRNEQAPPLHPLDNTDPAQSARTCEIDTPEIQRSASRPNRTNIAITYAEQDELGTNPKGPESSVPILNTSAQTSISNASSVLPFTARTTYDPTKSLHFAHINVDGFSREMEGFRDRLHWALNYALASRVLIFAFSETHLSINDSIDSENLHPLYQYLPGNDRVKRWGGTGLLIHRYIGIFKPLNETLQPKIENTTISFTMYSQSVIFSTVYLPQSSSSEIDNFFNHLDKILKMNVDVLIVTGDFNCRNEAWGDVKTNPRGKKLLLGLEIRNLYILQLPGPTRFDHANQTDSYLDLVITNDPSHFSPIELTTRVQDHATVDCNYLFKTGAGAIRKIFDFRKTYEHRSDILNNHFNSIDWKFLFVGQKVDMLPVIFTDAIQDGWEQNGIYKCVNSNSRLVKQLSAVGGPTDLD